MLVLRVLGSSEVSEVGEVGIGLGCVGFEVGFNMF